MPPWGKKKKKEDKHKHIYAYLCASYDSEDPKTKKKKKHQEPKEDQRKKMRSRFNNIAEDLKTRRRVGTLAALLEENKDVIQEMRMARK